MKPRNRVGDRAFFVTWCAQAVYDEYGDFDRDATEELERSRRFDDERKALQFGQDVWPQSRGVFGIVEVTESEFKPYDDADARILPHVGYWEPQRTNVFDGTGWEGWNSRESY